MTDYFKGLLQRSMGLAPVVKPLVRPQFAIDVASAGLRQPSAPAESQQFEAPSADIYRAGVGAEPDRGMNAPAPGHEGPRQIRQPPEATEASSAISTPQGHSGRETPVSRRRVTRSAGPSSSSGQDRRDDARQPTARPVEPAKGTGQLDIPVSRLISARPVRREGPAYAPVGVEAPLMPENSRSGEAPLSMPTRIRRDTTASAGEGHDDSATRGSQSGQEARHMAKTRLSFNRRAASNRGRPESDETAGEPAIEPSSRTLVPILDDSRADYAAGQQGTRVPSLRARERLASPEPPLPSIEVTIGRVEVRAILPPSTAPPAPTRRKSPIAPLDEYLKAQNEGRR